MEQVNKKISPIIVGAGGVASYLIPCLIRSFEIEAGLLLDGDTLEERNLDRQLFSKNDVGKNKAVALLELYDTNIEALDYYISPGAVDASNYDCIICCVDNHVARSVCLELAEQYRIKCYIAANEYFDSQAYLYDPDGPQTCDPRNRYPEILTDKSQDPVSCQGDELISYPQLAMSNFMAAAMLIQLMWVHEVSIKEWDGADYLAIAPKYPVELRRSEFNFEMITEEQLVTEANLQGEQVNA